MQVQCSECMKLHKYMIRVAKGVKWSADPEGSMRYSTYANGMLEERYICPPCLKIILFEPIGDTSKGVPVDEVEESTL